MTVEGKYSDIFSGPRENADGPWDKPLVFDDRSLPSPQDAARFNVAVAEGTVDELRAKAAEKAARSRALLGGSAPAVEPAPSRPTGVDAPAEWSPSARPWWKTGILTAAVALVSVAFVLALARPAVPKDTAVVETPTTGPMDPAAAPPPLMANPVSDGTMKFQVLTATPDMPVVSVGGSTVAATGAFLLVDMRVINTDSKSVSFDPLAQRVITNTGRQYGPQIEAQKLYSGADFLTPMEAGRQGEVRLAFDIPRDEVPMVLFLKAAEGSYGTTVKFA